MHTAALGDTTFAFWIKTSVRKTFFLSKLILKNHFYSFENDFYSFTFWFQESSFCSNTGIDPWEPVSLQRTMFWFKDESPAHGACDGPLAETWTDTRVSVHERVLVGRFYHSWREWPFRHRTFSNLKVHFRGIFSGSLKTPPFWVWTTLALESPKFVLERFLGNLPRQIVVQRLLDRLKSVNWTFRFYLIARTVLQVCNFAGFTEFTKICWKVTQAELYILVSLRL